MKSVQAAPQPPAYTSTDDIIGRARKMRARRTGATVAAGVAVLALAVTGASTLGSGGGGGAQQAAGPGASPMASFSAPPATPTDPPLPVDKVDFSTTFTGYRAGAYQVGPIGQVTDGYTELPVYRDGETWQDDKNVAFPYAGATITAYDKDVYNTDMFNAAGDATLRVGDLYDVTVNGKKAMARDFTYGTPGDANKDWVRTALAWQYADGAWATLMPNFYNSALSRDDAVKIAEGLTTKGKTKVKAPYHLTVVPKGWQAVGAIQSPESLGMALSGVTLHRGPVADPSTRVDAVLPGTLTIMVFKGMTEDELKGRGKVQGDGVHCAAKGQSCFIRQGDYTVNVDVYGDVLSDAQFRQVVDGIQLTDPADQKTWVPVTF
ncbi:hypothetical protein L083_6425 [Actinoplanes sp. N902-109]|nr:hypothetical protein L083_6425 [Actinoplanes sp. N902-109]